MTYTEKLFSTSYLVSFRSPFEAELQFSKRATKQQFSSFPLSQEDRRVIEREWPVSFVVLIIFQSIDQALIASPGDRYGIPAARKEIGERSLQEGKSHCAARFVSRFPFHPEHDSSNHRCITQIVCNLTSAHFFAPRVSRIYPLSSWSHLHPRIVPHGFSSQWFHRLLKK